MFICDRYRYLRLPRAGMTHCSYPYAIKHVLIVNVFSKYLINFSYYVKELDINSSMSHLIGKKFYVCACFFRQNIFLKDFNIHVEYEDDDDKFCQIRIHLPREVLSKCGYIETRNNTNSTC